VGPFEGRCGGDSGSRLDVIGEPWSPMTLRNISVGIDRFDHIQMK
jgi:hypothetical protein